MNLPLLVRLLALGFLALALIYTGVVILKLRRAQVTARPASPRLAAGPAEEPEEADEFDAYSGEEEIPLEEDRGAYPGEPAPLAATADQEALFFEGGMPESPSFDFEGTFSKTAPAAAFPGETEAGTFDLDADGSGSMPTAAPLTDSETIPPAIMEWVISADAYEGYPPGHARRIANTAKMLGRELMLEPGEISLLEAAALLHDVGEVNHDDCIHEPRSLSEAEWENLRQHPLRSEKTILQLPNLEKAAQWVRHHHERWDGRGYPDRLKGEKIPMPSRILAVADAWEAMTHDRPHRKAMGEFEAKEELRRLAGTQFDPAVIKALLPRVGPSVDEEIVLRLRKRMAKETTGQES